MMDKLFRKSVHWGLLLLLFCLSGQVTFALTKEKGTVRGQLVNESGIALAYASVAVTGTDHGTTTNLNGGFSLKLEPGNYTLTFSYTGCDSQNKSVEITGNKMHIDLGRLVLKASDQLISEIVVNRKMNVAHIEESDYVARLPIKNLENPQVYVTVSDKLLKQQVSTNLDGALKNVPGAGVPVRFNQNRIVFLSRGFTTEPKFRNGLATFLQTSIDPVNVVRIEVIKGPSATLFGSSVVSYGGLLNRVTKCPLPGRSLEIDYAGGSWNLNRLSVDVNHPLKKDESLLFRMNGAVHRENSFQDAGFNNTVALAPSVSYKLSDKAAILADLEYGRNNGTSPVRFAPYSKISGKRTIADMGIPYKRSFASNEVAYNSTSLNLFLRVDADLNNHWRSQSALSRTYSGFDGYTTQLTGRSDTTLRATITTGGYNYYSTDVQQNFIGEFNWLGLGHKMVFGLDYYNYSSRRNTANVYSATVDFRGSLDDYYQTFNRSYIDSEAAGATRRMENNQRNTYTSYVSDVISLARQLSVMMSLRLDHFRDKGTYDLSAGSTTGKYHQTVLSPKMGLVYQVVQDKLAVFGNYMNGFTNQNGTDKAGNTFKPENAIQYEAGVKADIWHKRLSGYASYYDILVRDILRDDPADADYSIQDGEQKSRGVEIQLTANATKGLTVLAGFAYNDSKYMKADETINGLRPASAGPETTVNWWLNYDLPSGVLDGFNIGFGGNYGSSSWQTNTTETQVVIPSYLTMDVSAGWQNKHFRVAVKVDNLTNEKYWSYRLAPQNPTRFTGAVSYIF